MKRREEPSIGRAEPVVRAPADDPYLAYVAWKAAQPADDPEPVIHASASQSTRWRVSTKGHSRRPKSRTTAARQAEGPASHSKDAS